MENVYYVGNSTIFYVIDLVIYLVSFLALLSGIFCIRAKYIKSQNQILLFKPLSLILIIFIALFFPTEVIRYKIFIIVGLLFSLVGDFLLIFPEKHFKNGLIAFLIGHIFYIIAFTVGIDFKINYWIFIPILISGITYILFIIPSTGKMKFQVSVYILVIAIMGWLAIERYFNLATFGALLAAVGATLFMISDATLAFNKFKKSFYFAELIILSTYFIAQWLLAISTIKI